MTEEARARRIDLLFRVAIIALTALWLAFPPAPAQEPGQPLTLSETRP